MISAKEFRILSLQMGIFTPALRFSSSEILGKLMGKFPDTFDGDPVAIPLPPDAPKEIPRLILPSSDGKTKLEISESKANFFRYRTEDDGVIDVNSWLKRGSDVFEEYIKCTFAKVGRLALVAIRFLENPNPGSTLAQHFCKEKWIREPFNRPESFEVHSHKKYEFSHFKVNSWVRCKSGILKKDNAPIILVEQDINTVSEEIDKKGFDNKQIRSFADLATKEQESVLNKYWGGSDE